MKIPSSLYKYESFSNQSLLNLKKQIIYFGSPSKFNDPYDCALTPNLSVPSDAEVEALREFYLTQPKLPNQARAVFRSSTTEDLRTNFTNAARRGLSDAIHDFSTKRGVSCFSEKNDDLLMWSHYGGRYQGLCLEFKTSSAPFQKTKPVRYVTEPPIISVTSAIHGDLDAVAELFCTKSAAWAYEKEWRVIHQQANTEFCYTPDTLTGVYFGPDIDAQSMEIVCLILAGQNEYVKFWRGTRSTSEFKVQFEQFNYTPYLEAKRQGLTW
jgi:Protein of unknown function (DUF2971)